MPKASRIAKPICHRIFSRAVEMHVRTSVRILDSRRAFGSVNRNAFAVSPSVSQFATHQDAVLEFNTQRNLIGGP